MFSVNIFIKRVIVRVTTSFIFCLLVILIAKQFADTRGYVGEFELAADGDSTNLVITIFKFLPTYGNLLFSILLVSVISSTLIFIILKNYINKFNHYDWYLLLYLPTLLIYASAPSKESLFFIPALIYIIIESEHLIKNNL